MKPQAVGQALGNGRSADHVSAILCTATALVRSEAQMQRTLLTVSDAACLDAERGDNCRLRAGSSAVLFIFAGVQGKKVANSL